MTETTRTTTTGVRLEKTVTLHSEREPLFTLDVQRTYRNRRRSETWKIIRVDATFDIEPDGLPVVTDPEDDDPAEHVAPVDLPAHVRAMLAAAGVPDMGPLTDGQGA